MSIDAKISIKAVPDKASASQAGREIAKEVRKEASSGGAAPGGSSIAPAGDASAAPAAAAAQNTQMREWGRLIATEFAKIAGSKIAQFVGGFFLHEGVSTAFRLARTPGQDNNGVEMAEAGVTASISGAQAGAMIGAGPAGIAVGALLAGLNAVLLKEKEIADRLKQLDIDYKRERWNVKQEAKQAAFGTLFDRSLSMMSNRAQIEEMGLRISALTGSGETKEKAVERFNRERSEYSAALMSPGRNPDHERLIAAQERWDAYADELRAHLEAAASGNYVDAKGNPLTSFNGNAVGTVRYLETMNDLAKRVSGKDFQGFGEGSDNARRIESALQRANNEIDPLQTRQFNAYLAQYDLMRTNAIAKNEDDMMRKGMGVGATIDVTTVPKQQLDVLKRIEDLIRNPNRTGDPFAQMQAVFGY